MSPRTANHLVAALTVAAVVFAAFGFASAFSDGPHTKLWGVALVLAGLAIRSLQPHGKRTVAETP